MPAPPLFWLEKGLLLLDYLQGLALLYAFGRPWPWPQGWLDRYRWLSWAALDLPTAFSGDYADTAPTVRGSVYGTLPAYWAVALAWSAALAAGCAVLFITKAAQKVRPFSMPSWHPAAAQGVIIAARALQLPASLALLRMYPCEKHPLYAAVESGPSRLAVDPEVSCGSAGHVLLMLLFVVPSALAVIGIPACLAYVARCSLVYAEPHRHERWLRWKDASVALGLDQSGASEWGRWVVSSFLRGRGHPYRHAAWTATMGGLAVVYAFARFSQTLQAGLLFFAFGCWGTWLLFAPGYRCVSTALAARVVGLSLALQAFWGLLRASGTVTYFTVDSSLLASLEGFNLGVAIVLGVIFVGAAMLPGAGWPRGYVGPHLWAAVAGAVGVNSEGATTGATEEAEEGTSIEVSGSTEPQLRVVAVDDGDVSEEAATLTALPLDDVEAATLAALLPAAAAARAAARSSSSITTFVASLPCLRCARRAASNLYSPVPGKEHTRHRQGEETPLEALQRRFGVVPGAVLHGLAAACRLRPALPLGWAATDVKPAAAAALVQRRDARVLATALGARQLLLAMREDPVLLDADASDAASSSPEDARHAAVAAAAAGVWDMRELSGTPSSSSSCTATLASSSSPSTSDDYLSILDISALEFTWVSVVKAYRADEAHMRRQPRQLVDLPRLQAWAALLGAEQERAARARHVLEWSLEDALFAARTFIEAVARGNVMADAYARLHLPALRARLATREREVVFMKPTRRHILLKLLAVRCFVGGRCRGPAGAADSPYYDVSPEEIQASTLSVATLREILDAAVLPRLAAEVAPSARRRDEGDPRFASEETAALLLVLAEKVAATRAQRLAALEEVRASRRQPPDATSAAALALSLDRSAELELFELNALLRRATWLKAKYCAPA